MSTSETPNAGPEKHTHSKPRLGRGLSSLIANSAQLASTDGQYDPAGASHSAAPSAAALLAPAHASASHEIMVDQISPNPYQPRREFDPQQLAELTQSIVQQGVLQPLLVAKMHGGDSGRPYVVIAGERRLRAATAAGLKTVPCVVKQATPQQMLEWALIENIQRSDLNPIERAQAYRQYMDRFNLSQADASERLGQPRTTVVNYLRILELEKSVQEMIGKGTVSFGHAKVLASLVGQMEKQTQLARRVCNDGLSVRELESLVAEISAAASAQAAGASGAAGRAARPPVNRPAYLRDIEERLTAAVGTKVCVFPGRAKNTGRIVVEFYSLDDFDRIAAKLGMSDDSI